VSQNNGKRSVGTLISLKKLPQPQPVFGAFGSVYFCVRAKNCSLTHLHKERFDWHGDIDSKKIYCQQHHYFADGRMHAC